MDKLMSKISGCSRSEFNELAGRLKGGVRFPPKINETQDAYLFCLHRVHEKLCQHESLPHDKSRVRKVRSVHHQGMNDFETRKF